MTELELILVGVAAVAGGAVNALAGGGTLITFPMLTAVGVSTVAANITNTVALCPGYLGATFAQIRDLSVNKGRLWLLGLTGALGGLAGGVLLLNTDENGSAKHFFCIGEIQAMFAAVAPVLPFVPFKFQL